MPQHLQLLTSGREWGEAEVASYTNVPGVGAFGSSMLVHSAPSKRLYGDQSGLQQQAVAVQKVGWCSFFGAASPKW